MKTYVQIGANRGNDSFFRKMSVLPEAAKIVLVEANDVLIADLERCYTPLAHKHVVYIFNNGLVHDRVIDTLVLYNNGASDGLSSVLNRKSYICPTTTIKFAPITFDQLCHAADITHIEELQIDVEGYDYAILNSIDFARWQPKIVNCEVWPYAEDSTSLIRTGPTYFATTIKPKMEEFYVITETVLDNMRTHVFTRK